jgi:hypothetical protein
MPLGWADHMVAFLLSIAGFHQTLRSKRDSKPSIGYIRFDNRARFVQESGPSSIDSIQARQHQPGHRERRSKCLSYRVWLPKPPATKTTVILGHSSLIATESKGERHPNANRCNRHTRCDFPSSGGGVQREVSPKVSDTVSPVIPPSVPSRVLALSWQMGTKRRQDSRQRA